MRKIKFASHSPKPLYRVQPEFSPSSELWFASSNQLVIIQTIAGNLKPFSWCENIFVGSSERTSRAGHRAIEFAGYAGKHKRKFRHDGANLRSGLFCFGRKAVGTYTREKEPLKGPLRWPPGTSVLVKIKLEVTLAPTRGALPRCSFFLWGRAHKALARGTRPPENRSGSSWTEGACRGCARSVA